MADVQNWNWTRAIFDHVHLRVADLARSRAFYSAALEPLGIPLLLDTPHLIQFANLALSADKPPSTGAHLAFTAGSRAEVDAFHAAAIAAGGTDNGTPARATTAHTRPMSSTPTAPTSRPRTVP